MAVMGFCFSNRNGSEFKSDFAAYCQLLCGNFKMEGFGGLTKSGSSLFDEKLLGGLGRLGVESD